MIERPDDRAAMVSQRRAEPLRRDGHTPRFRELVCPHCRSDKVRLSKKRGAKSIDLIATAYRCRDCNRRFWHGDPKRVAAASLALVLALLAVIGVLGLMLD